MNQIASALLEPPAPAPHGKEPPGSPPDTPFSTVLDDHQARTAVAEGHQRDDSASAPVAERDAQAPADRGAGGDADDRDRSSTPDAKHDGPATAALAALLGGVPLPVGASVAVAAGPVAAVAGAGSAQPGPLGGRVLSDPVPPTQARTPVTDRGTPVLTATRPIGVPADAAALPMRPVPSAAVAPSASSPSLPIGPGAVGAEARAATAGAGAPAARAARLADVLQAATARPAAPAAPAATPAPATVAGAATAAPAAAAHAAAPARGAQAAAVSAPTLPAAAPTASAGAAQGAATADDPAATRGVGLERAVETVRLALRAAADRGVTHARISLNPRELGSIEVHLRQTADGLVARVVAQHGAAAQLLQDNGADLRRQLEQSGLTLLRLDIGASNDDARRPGERALAAFAARASAPSAAADPLDATTETTATATLALPNGTLVDVLA